MSTSEDTSITDNNILIRDLEIEINSSSQSLNVDKYVNILKQIQEIHDSFQAQSKKLKEEENQLESDLLDQQILFEKTALLCNENKRLWNELTKEKNEVHARYHQCQEAEQLSQMKFAEIEPLHKDLQKQSYDVDSLNQEIVGSEFEKRNLERDVVLEELLASRKELDVQNKLLSDVVQRYNNSESSQESANQHLREKKSTLNDLRDESKVTENQKRVEQARKEISSVEEALRVVKEEVEEMKRMLLEEDARGQELDKIQSDVDCQLKQIQCKNNELEDEVATLAKSLSVAQAQLHSYATTRMQLEIDLKEANESYRHENASAILHRKQFDRMKILYLKKKRIIDKTSDLISEMKVSLYDNEILIKSQDAENEEQIKAIEIMKDDMNVKITRLMEQQHVEDEVKKEFNAIVKATQELESEIDRWKTEVKKLSKIVTILNIQRETQMRKTRNLISSESETLEMIKLKNLVVMDMKKALHETNKRVMEFNALYEVLTGKRIEINGAISAAVSAVEQMRKKVDEHQQKLQTLNQSQELKRMVLVKESDAHKNTKVSCASIRAEKTKLHAELRQKRDERDSQVLHIAKLNSMLVCLQKEATRLQIRNSTLENGKRLIVEQLDLKKVEIHKKLQKANAYEEALKKGELAIQQKKEDIRTLKLECSHVERFVSVKKSLQKDINPYKEQVGQLENELQIQREQVKALSSQIENPIQSDHWRQLGGEDPDDEQLDAKINVLEQRLSDSREQLMAKEVVLEETKSNVIELEAKIQSVGEVTQPMMNHLNECQNRHRGVTRSMMALVSELSMYQAMLLKLEEEKEYQEEVLDQSRQLMKEGKAPSDEAHRDLKRLLRERKIDMNISMSEQYADDFGRVYYPAPYALRTTAEPRHTAYIPDTGLEIPKPFGAMAPFKPTCNAASIQQIRSPA